MIDYLILQPAYLSQQRGVQWRGWCAAGNGGRGWREEGRRVIKREVGGARCDKWSHDQLSSDLPSTVSKPKLSSGIVC